MFNILYKSYKTHENNINNNYKKNIFLKTNNLNNLNVNSLSNDNFKKYIINSHLNSLSFNNVMNNKDVYNKKIDVYNKKIEIINSLNNTLSNEKIITDVHFIILAIASSVGFFLFYRYQK